MSLSIRRSALGVGLVAAGFASSAQAAPIADTYWGGNDGSFNADVVGDVAQFQVNNATVTRTGNDLTVVFDTTYSGANVGTLGTNLGALFFGELSQLNLAGAGPAYNDDTFVNDPDRFSYVFDFDAIKNGSGVVTDADGVINTGSVPSSQSGNATLYSLLETGADVVKSNINGNTAATNIRRDQAVDIADAYKTLANTVLTGTWETTTGSVTFNLVNFFSTLPSIYSTSFTLGWAMTCANDTFLTRVAMSGNVGEEVPIPAGLALLFSGVLGLGFLGRFRAKTAAT